MSLQVPMKSFALASALALASMVITPAFADDQVADDLDSTKKEAKSKAKNQRAVREVVRGVFVKSNAGTTMFFGPRGSLLQPGTAVSLALGMDFIDKEKTSAAVDVFFHQSLNNGVRWNDARQLANVGNPNLLIQGDIHTYTGGVAFEYSFYPSRRIGIGARAGGGVGFAPLLMSKAEYQDVVLAEWQSNPPRVHTSPLPYITVGPTIEYYTKLSHFSIGLDAAFVMYIGLDFGADISGYLKYTF